jgi:hypothetical protein
MSESPHRQPASGTTITGSSFGGGVIMETKLTANLILTDERSKSTLKMPVLVNLRMNVAYNPSDQLEAYPSGGKLQARDVVKRLVNEKSFTDREKYLIERFTGKVF